MCCAVSAMSRRVFSRPAGASHECMRAAREGCSVRGGRRSYKAGVPCERGVGGAARCSRKRSTSKTLHGVAVEKSSGGRR